MSDELDRLALNNMVNALQYKQQPVPIPRPDPRGTTFNSRLPRQIQEYQYDIQHRPFGPETVPSQLLLGLQGLSPNADRQAVINPYQVAFPSLPPTYGVGRNKIYTSTQEKYMPPAQDKIAEYLKKNAL